MTRIKRLTLDDLLPGSKSDTFVINQDKKGKPKVVRKRNIPVPYEFKYRTFFRLIKDNPSIPDPVEEFKFHPTRRWRVDICWPDQKLALEIEGGTFMGKGAHRGSISGYLKDKEKYNQLAIHGFHLLRATPQEMESCESYDFVREWFKTRSEFTKNKIVCND